jgi:transcriptional regulator with XRE-family HTH domain
MAVDIENRRLYDPYIERYWPYMISAGQLRAARALLGIDQRDLADMSDLSAPTIQRMEASEGVIRGNVDSLMKLVAALDAAGIELIGEGAVSQGGGRGVRLKAVAAGRQLSSQKSRKVPARRAG